MSNQRTYKIEGLSHSGIRQITYAAPAATTTTTSSSSSSGLAIKAPQRTVVSQIWALLKAGKQVAVTIRNSYISFTKVLFTSNADVKKAEVKIYGLTGKPASLPDIDNAYKFMQIISNVDDDTIAEGIIEFKVSQSWIKDNVASEDGIRLYRYEDGWKQLTTVRVAEDSEYVYYEATTPGFSYFAIVAGEAKLSAIELIDLVRAFYDGKLSISVLDLIDKVRAFYGG